MARRPAAAVLCHGRGRGFEPAFSLVTNQVRGAGEARGFAVARLVTHWAETVGEDLAKVTRPVKIGYSQGGMGATLSILVQGAHAPMVGMQLERIRERVNAVYGYNAISRVHLTQTAGAGFAEGQAQFAALVDNAAKNAPAGSETAVAMMKSAVAAANNAFESVQKAVKQASDVAEANFNAVTTSATTAAKNAGAAAKKAAR